MKEKLIAVVGSTAVGKSSVAVELAGILNSEVISADSAQVYQQLNIGSAKLTHDEMYSKEGKFVPHHLLDCFPPTYDFNIAKFQDIVRPLISSLNDVGKIPVIAGGSGLYVNSIVNDYNMTTQENDSEYRKQLMKICDIKGQQYLYDMLKQVAPNRAGKIHPNDLRRIIRGLEVANSAVDDNIVEQYNSNYNVTMIGLYMDRQKLYDRINMRVDLMMEMGLLDEVRKLVQSGVPADAVSMQALAYKELVSYLNGEIDLDEAVRIIKRNTRHFAKRQLTWFMRDPRIVWYMVDRFSSASDIADHVYNYLMQENFLKNRI